MHVVCMKERFSCVNTPKYASDITVDGEVWLCDNSYSFVYYFFFKEMSICMRTPTLVSVIPI